MDSLPEEEHHRRYRTRKEWLVEEGMENWNDIIHSAIPIFSHIFGCTPVMELTLSSDLELNEALCIPLGIVPKEIEEVIKVMGRGIYKYHYDKNISNAIQNDYDKRWNEIKDILKARVMGLHSIVGGISSAFEKEMKRKSDATRTSINSLNRSAH